MAAKLPGPTLTEKFRGLFAVIPERWKARLGWNVTKQKNPDDATPSALTGGIVESTLTTDQTNEVLKTNTSIDGSLPATITDTKITTQFGGGVLNVEETLSQGSLSVEGGLLVTEGSVTDLGGINLKTTETLQDAAWPVLHGTHVDEATGIVVNYTKQVVAAGTTGGVVGSTYTEIEPLDKWRSLKISSTVNLATLPTDKQFLTTLRESFPPELRDVQLFQIEGSAFGIQPADAYNLVEGYSGPCNARITEKYMTEAQYRTWKTKPVGTLFPLCPEVTQFFPQANRLMVPLGLGQVIQTREYPVSLHEEYTLNVFGATLTLPATVPPKLPYESWIVVSIQAQRWRFGIRYIEITEVQVPPDFNNERF